MVAITLPETLTKRLGSEAAHELAVVLSRAIDTMEERSVNAAIERSADRFEKRLVEETSKLDGRITEVRLEVASVDRKITDIKSDLIRWMIGIVLTVSLTQTGFITALIYFLHN